MGAVILRRLLGFLVLNGVLLLLFRPENLAAWASLALLNVLGALVVLGGTLIPADKPHAFFAYSVTSVFAVAFLFQLVVTVVLLVAPPVSDRLDSGVWLRVFMAVELVVVGGAAYSALRVGEASRRATQVSERDDAARTFARRAEAAAQAVADSAGPGSIYELAQAVAEALKYAPTSTNGSVQHLEDAIESSLREARVHQEQGDLAMAEAALAECLQRVGDRTRELRWHR